MKENGQFYAPVALPTIKDPLLSLDRRLGDSQSRSSGWKKNQIAAPARNPNIISCFFPAHSLISVLTELFRLQICTGIESLTFFRNKNYVSLQLAEPKSLHYSPRCMSESLHSDNRIRINRRLGGRGHIWRNYSLLREDLKKKHSQLHLSPFWGDSNPWSPERKAGMIRILARNSDLLRFRCKVLNFT
jgi:hypothetical protein